MKYSFEDVDFAAKKLARQALRRWCDKHIDYAGNLTLVRMVWHQATLPFWRAKLVKRLEAAGHEVVNTPSLGDRQSVVNHKKNFYSAVERAVEESAGKTFFEGVQI